MFDQFFCTCPLAEDSIFVNFFFNQTADRHKNKLRVCVCVCVCVWGERERERRKTETEETETERQGDREMLSR